MTRTGPRARISPSQAEPPRSGRTSTVRAAWPRLRRGQREGSGPGERATDHPKRAVSRVGSGADTRIWTADLLSTNREDAQVSADAPGTHLSAVAWLVDAHTPVSGRDRRPLSPRHATRRCQRRPCRALAARSHLDGQAIAREFTSVTDLGAIDVMRAYDQGMPPYNDMREAYGLARVGTDKVSLSAQVRLSRWLGSIRRLPTRRTVSVSARGHSRVGSGY